MDAKVFMEALDEIEATKGISKQSIIDALKEALRKALEKSCLVEHMKEAIFALKLVKIQLPST
jgi:hypothetical protein